MPSRRLPTQATGRRQRSESVAVSAAASFGCAGDVHAGDGQLSKYLLPRALFTLESGEYVMDIGIVGPAVRDAVASRPRMLAIPCRHLPPVVGRVVRVIRVQETDAAKAAAD